MKKYVLILGILASFNVHAASSGNCGPINENGAYSSSCTWKYNELTHTLDITGDGYMADLGAHCESSKCFSDAPWSGFNAEIEHVSIGGNLKNIGAYTIYEMSKFPETTISAPIERIGPQSMKWAVGYELPETVKIIDDAAFSWTLGIQSIIIPDSVEKIGAGAFYQTSAKKIFLGSGLTSIGANAFFSDYSAKEKFIIYCEDTTQNRCSDLIGENNDDYVSNIQTFTRDKDTGVYELNGIYYANADLLIKEKPCNNKTQCDEIAQKVKKGLNFEFNGKTYSSLANLAKGIYIPKRIYTIDEAEKVSKKTGNTFRIRYR